MKRRINLKMFVKYIGVVSHRDLSVLCDNFDVTSLRGTKQKMNSSNILDVAAANAWLSSVLRLQLLGEKAHNRMYEPDLTGLDTTTLAERTADQV